MSCIVLHLFHSRQITLNAKIWLRYTCYKTNSPSPSATALVAPKAQLTPRRCLHLLDAFDKRLQLARPRRMPQLAQRLGFDLPNAFARDLEALSHLFQRVLRAVLQPKAHLDNALFPRGKSPQNLRRVLLQIHADHGLARRNRLPVFNEVAQVRVFLFTDRRLQRNRLLRDLQYLAHLRYRNVHAPRDLFARRLTAQFLHQLPACADELVDRLDHVHRDTNRSRLVRNRTRNRLANPPRRIRRELVTTPILEFIHCLHQADIALLNQVQELQSAIRVFLRDRNHQTKVGFNQLALRLLGVHVALDHLALRALQLDNRHACVALDLFEVHFAVLLLAPILLLQLIAL